MSVHVATEGQRGQLQPPWTRDVLRCSLPLVRGTDYYVLGTSTLLLKAHWGGFLFLATKYVLTMTLSFKRKLNKFHQEIPLLIYFN